LEDITSNIETEFRDFYLRQMRLRDRAKRQLLNIQQARDWLGLKLSWKFQEMQMSTSNYNGPRPSPLLRNVAVCIKVEMRFT